MYIIKDIVIQYILVKFLVNHGVYGVFVGGSTVAEGRSHPRVAKLHWSTRNIQLLRMDPRSCRHCNGHTPDNGFNPPAELRQGSWITSRLGNG